MIHFGAQDDGGLEEISWDAFFDALEENELALFYQPQHADGGDSTFQEFVSR